MFLPPPLLKKQGCDTSSQSPSHVCFIERQSVWENLSGTGSKERPQSHVVLVLFPGSSNPLQTTSLHVYTHLYSCFRSGWELERFGPWTALLIPLLPVVTVMGAGEPHSDSSTHRSVFICFNVVAFETEKYFYFVLKPWVISENRTEQRDMKKGANKMSTQQVKMLADELMLIPGPTWYPPPYLSFVLHVLTVAQYVLLPTNRMDKCK